MIWATRVQMHATNDAVLVVRPPPRWPHLIKALITIPR